MVTCVKKQTFIKSIFFIVFLAALLSSCASAPAAPEDTAEPDGFPAYCALPEGSPVSAGSFDLSSGPVGVAEYRLAAGCGCTADARCYRMQNGDSVFAASIRPDGAVLQEEPAETIRVFEIERGSIEVRYYRDGAWVSSCEEGLYSAGCVFLETDEDSYIFYLPQMAEHIENGCVRMIPEQSGVLILTRTDSGRWTAEVSVPAPAEGCSADFFLLRASGRPVGRDSEDETSLWQILTNDGTWRMLYDGYYFASPDTYEPAGENVFANRPACHLARVLIYHGGEFPAMAELNTFVLDTMLRGCGEDGYWPSGAKSTWLSADYGIGAGYYDTRFNSDLIETLLLEYEETAWPETAEAVGTYLDFYLPFAETYGWTTEGGGLFVPDYYYPGMKTPHTALNHQLAEISVLYRAAEILGREDCRILAGRMLFAIEETQDSWIKEDGNLEYAVYPDGQFGGTDYPFLTYNDLFSLQELLSGMGMDRSGGLQKLMDSKRSWMDRNGITDYSR